MQLGAESLVFLQGENDQREYPSKNSPPSLGARLGPLRWNLRSRILSGFPFLRQNWFRQVFDNRGIECGHGKSGGVQAEEEV